MKSTLLKNLAAVLECMVKLTQIYLLHISFNYKPKKILHYGSSEFLQNVLMQNKYWKRKHFKIATKKISEMLSKMDKVMFAYFNHDYKLKKSYEKPKRNHYVRVFSNNSIFLKIL